jgi:hypothetical protein
LPQHNRSLHKQKESGPSPSPSFLPEAKPTPSRRTAEGALRTTTGARRNSSSSLRPVARRQENSLHKNRCKAQKNLSPQSLKTFVKILANKPLFFVTLWSLCKKKLKNQKI